jgi:proline iminopeptidase
VADYLGESVLAGWLESSFRVCSYDQRGCRHSKSDGPFNVRANVRDIEAVRETLGAEPVTLIGHSWGALLAVCYCAEFGQRLARLVLISPTSPEVARKQIYLRRIEANHTPEQKTRLARIDAELARTLDERSREALYHERFNVALPSYLSRDHRHKAPRIDWYSRRINIETMADVYARSRDPQWLAGLKHLRAPTLIVHGREDVIPWDAVDEILSLIPHAEVIGLDDCGHFPWLETPDAFRGALSGFLGVQA